MEIDGDGNKWKHKSPSRVHQRSLATAWASTTKCDVGRGKEDGEMEMESGHGKEKRHSGIIKEVNKRESKTDSSQKKSPT